MPVYSISISYNIHEATCTLYMYVHASLLVSHVLYVLSTCTCTCTCRNVYNNVCYVIGVSNQKQSKFVLTREGIE